jgi:hypothetical protein
MASSIFNGPLKLAGVLMLASLPFLWWAADRADQDLHLLVAAGVVLATIATGVLAARLDQQTNLPAARRLAARLALLMAMFFMWGSVAILTSYYLTDLSWYHAYQYAAYAAVPGLIPLAASRQYMTASDAELRHHLDRGRRLAMLQAALMLMGILYMTAVGKIGDFARADWAAMNILLAGAVAIAALSIIAIAGDYRLRPKT